MREGIELGCAVERELGQTFLLPDLPYFVGLPDEVGNAVERQHEVGGRPTASSHMLCFVGERDADKIQPNFRRGEDRRLLDVSQRPLRERREGADLLDLVAEELDPERLAARGREDVDEPAAHRELAALLDAFDPLVAG